MTTKEQLEERLRNLEERLRGPMQTADERATILAGIAAAKDDLKNLLKPGMAISVPKGKYELISFDEEGWGNTETYRELPTETEGILMFYVDHPANAWNILIAVTDANGETEHLIIEAPEKDVMW